MGDRVSVTILGSRGRMGRALAHLIEGEFAASARIQGLLHSQSSDSEWEDAMAADVWVDFSLPQSTPRLHKAFTEATRALPAIVMGTTGHPAAEKALLEALSKKTQMLQASNFSAGVLALRKALEFISPMLAQSGFRPLMVETHHVHKKDSPSGTALTLAAATSGMSPERIHSIRAGEVVGDHRIEFHGHGERVTIEHHAMSREIFARGALEVALWLARRHKSEARASGWVTLDDFFEEKFKCPTPSR